MIELKNIHKTYPIQGGEQEALREVSLTLETGKMVAVMGPSGSGKSTLLNILGGMDSVTSGEYCYDGQPVHRMKSMQRQKFCRDTVSFIFQDFALLEDYTAYENVELPLLIKGCPARKRKEIVTESLKKAGIYELRKKFPRQLSGGEQQRCAIARSVASGNPLVLADEPTGALDLENGDKIMALLKDMNEEGKTVVIVTHNPEVAQMCDGILYLEDGRLVEQLGGHRAG